MSEDILLIGHVQEVVFVLHKPNTGSFANLLLVVQINKLRVMVLFDKSVDRILSLGVLLEVLMVFDFQVFDTETNILCQLAFDSVNLILLMNVEHFFVELVGKHLSLVVDHHPRLPCLLFLKSVASRLFLLFWLSIWSDDLL